MSFKELINQYGKSVLNTAIRILRDDQKALDVHQEVFLEMLRRWHKFDGETNWGAYLYRTTVRKAIDSVRQSRRQPQVQQQLEPPTDNRQPDGPSRVAELQESLDECLGKLPRSQAEAFVLCRIEGLESRKAAEIMGCSYGAIRVHLYRATRRLSRELRGHLDK
ncbi:MAG: RNA polymerase sigma factor [Planctomycetota bacterium]|jgi:RNA polymerase sigma-70 factor (ECF subfamily)